MAGHLIFHQYLRIEYRYSLFLNTGGHRQA